MRLVDFSAPCGPLDTSSAPVGGPADKAGHGAGAAGDTTVWRARIFRNEPGRTFSLMTAARDASTSIPSAFHKEGIRPGSLRMELPRLSARSGRVRAVPGLARSDRVTVSRVPYLRNAAI